MKFFRDISIRRGGADLIEYIRTPGRNNPLLLIAACVPTAIIIYTFYLDALEKSKPAPPEVIYFESWPADRSVEESLKAITERQKEKDQIRLREKEAYKALGRAVGMDVDEIEREADADRIAAGKAKAEADTGSAK